MKKLLIFLLVVIIFSTAANTKAAESIVDFTVEPDPATVGVKAEYRISIKFSKSLYDGDYVYLQFDPLYSLPASIQINKIRLYTGTETTVPEEVTVDGSTIAIKLDLEHVIVPYEPVVILIYKDAGIVNPVYAGAYKLKAWTTSEQSAVASASYFIGQSSSGSVVTGVSVKVGNPNSGKQSQYEVSFVTSSQSALVGASNDYIDIYFPIGTILPTKPSPSSILVNYDYCQKVEVAGNKLRAYVPVSRFIAPGGNCAVLIKEDFGIINPLLPGDYAIQVSTSKDTGLATSGLYNLEGTSITLLNVQVDPARQATKASYKITFTTSVGNGLKKDTDKIYIKLPLEVTIPQSLIPGAITVNGVPCVQVSKEEQTLAIVSPKDVSKGGDVAIEIKVAFGLVNPKNVGTYAITVYTSQDTSPVEDTFVITQSTVSEADVQVIPSSSGQVAKYIISFNLGAGGKLTAGIEKINIAFPVGTVVPSSIGTSSVTVNGNPAAVVEVNGTTVSITVPFDIAAEASVTISFLESAGLRNPASGGNYKIYVNTTKETTSVGSRTYAIVATPVTSATVMPSAPDGLNGYYRTKPTVSLSSSSSIDISPSIFYYFDTNSPASYSSAITVPEGIHTLYYYAVDKEDHVESAKSILFKVDTIPPQIVLTTPEDGAVLNQKSVVVTGKVDAGSTVKINGNVAQVDGLGNFALGIEIVDNPQLINITAIDEAGNSAQKTVSVSLDTVSPPLSISKPAMFQQISKLPIVVEGTTEKGATITVNGNIAIVNETGGFSFSITSAPDSSLFNIEVVAKDAAGNSTKKIVTVRYSKSVTMILQVGNAFALVNGQTYTLEAAPMISSGRTMVPLRFVGEAFGAEFTYEASSKTIDIAFGSDKIRMQIGKKAAVVNGKEVVLDAAPFIVNGRTLVPIRFISETFGAEVVWDGVTKTVTIVYPKQ